MLPQPPALEIAAAVQARKSGFTAAARTKTTANARTTPNHILTPGDPRVVEEEEGKAETLEADRATKAETETKADKRRKNIE